VNYSYNILDYAIENINNKEKTFIIDKESNKIDKFIDIDIQKRNLVVYMVIE
jgi:hypothetical protein